MASLGELLANVSVSRETLRDLDAYLAKVIKWNPAINLVSPVSLRAAQQRHVIDSAQLLAHAPSVATRWADLGSGGGFPGIVIAIFARELRPDLHVTLVEADKRKAAFLRLVAAELSLDVQIFSERIDHCPPLFADVVSARALAPLKILCGFAEMHLASGGMALFPKGASYAQEVTAARIAWSFDLDVLPSMTDDRARILSIKELCRV